jgi:hypothetical protein
MAARFSKAPRKIKKQPDFVGEFKQMYKSMVAASKRLTNQKGKLRHLELHPSSYPYCFLKHFREMCLNPPNGKNELPYSMDIYVNIGTAVHEVVQTHLGYTGRILGDWTCPWCKHKKEFSRKPKCPKCGELMTYEELGVRIGKRTVGHVDGVMKTASGKYVVIDYKTSSIKAMELYRRSGKGYPYHHNVEQIKSYCYYLSRIYGIEIEGFLLVYLARDDAMTYFEPVGVSLTEQDLADIGKEMKMWDKQFDQVVRITKLEEILVMVEHKPCKTRKDYEGRYDDDFNPCPLADICLSKDKRLLNMELEILFDSADHLPLTSEPLANHP